MTHAAYHILFTPQKVESEMCPLCFGPSADCPPYILNTGQPRILCTTYASTATVNRVHEGVTFSFRSMAKVSENAPSTNRPIICPECRPQPISGRFGKARIAVWSYNMKAHWKRLHRTSTMPPSLENIIKLGEGEKAQIKKLTFPPKKQTTRGK